MVFWKRFLSGLATLLIFSVAAVANAPLLSEEAELSELRWRKVIIPIAFSNSLLKPNQAIRPESDVQGAVRRSLETWESVANIEFQVTWTEKLSVSPAGNFGDGTSLVTIAPTAENLSIFNADANEISARTRIFFNRKGYISEADIVLNSYQQFSTDGALGTFDLESTLTHEIGHLLGLEHSQVTGATMNEFQGKNGVYNLSSFSPRTLGEDDITAVRGIYGAKSAEDECCGAVEGKLILANGKAAKNFQVWLEEKETGKVVRGVAAGADGSFRFAGLNENKYRILTQDAAHNLTADELGEVDVVRGKSTVFNKKINVSARNFDVQYIGFNGQLSKLAVTVNAGRAYQIYVGGRNLNPEDFKISTNTSFITVTSGNLTKYDYGKDISVFSFEVKIEPETPVGDYSISLAGKDGKSDILVGALTVEKFVNPWSIYVFN